MQRGRGEEEGGSYSHGWGANAEGKVVELEDTQERGVVVQSQDSAHTMVAISGKCILH